MKLVNWIVGLGALWASSYGFAEELQNFCGEKLTYRLRWGAITAGTATFAADGKHDFNGTQTMKFTMQAKTTPFLDRIYKVRDTIMAVTTPELDRALHYEKDQKEGSHVKDITVSFDWDAKTAQYANNKKPRDPVAIEDGTLDPLSLLYNIRQCEMAEGQELSVPLTDGKRFSKGKAVIVGHDVVKIGGKKIPAILVEPDTGELGGVFKKSKDAKLQVWFSDTPARIPLKFRSKVVVGSFTGELIGLSLPDGQTLEGALGIANVKLKK